MVLPTRHDNTAMASWNPFRELDEIQSRLSRLLGSTLSSTQAARGSWTAPLDIEETDDGFVVEAELPEVKREDVDVELDGNELSIHGEVTKRERVGILRRQSRHTGQFDYRVTLPEQVDPDSTEASLKACVLRLKLHKSEPRRRRHIEFGN